jgi:hypothetical protein
MQCAWLFVALMIYELLDTFLRSLAVAGYFMVCENILWPRTTSKAGAIFTLALSFFTDINYANQTNTMNPNYRPNKKQQQQRQGTKPPRVCKHLPTSNRYIYLSITQSPFLSHTKEFFFILSSACDLLQSICGPFFTNFLLASTRN